jgi:hypothetical protein
MENESLKDLQQEIQELSEFIRLVVCIIENCDNLEISFPNTLEDHLAGYAVCVKTQKGIFPITISSGNGEWPLVSFIKIRDYTSRNNCSGVIVTKEEPISIEGKVNSYNEINRENKIYLVSGTDKEELKNKLLEVLK